MIVHKDHAQVQAIARSVLTKLGPTIRPQDSERTIAERAIQLLADADVVATWYHECPALVLLGSRSCLSLSGRDYRPAEELVGQVNVVTVDLSPRVGDACGDCARTFVVESGVTTARPIAPEFCRGLEVEQLVHARIQEFATPVTTFGELYRFAREELLRQGFANLDFRGNLGHSIGTRREDCLYVEEGNKTPLSAVPLFTFEPHIRAVGGSWGFKHEETYRFDSTARLQVL